MDPILRMLGALKADNLTPLYHCIIATLQSLKNVSCDVGFVSKLESTRREPLVVQNHSAFYHPSRTVLFKTPSQKFRKSSEHVHFT